MSVFESPFFHQFMVCAFMGVLLGQISIAIIQAPRWLVAMLSNE